MTIRKLINEMIEAKLAESENPKTGYPEYIGKKPLKYNGAMSKAEKEKYQNKPNVGDTVLHGNTGNYGKVTKITPTHVHVLYKGSKTPYDHSKNDTSFMHQHVHHDGKSHFQVLQF